MQTQKIDDPLTIRKKKWREKKNRAKADLERRRKSRT
jgi:hypothetical protein